MGENGHKAHFHLFCGNGVEAVGFFCDPIFDIWKSYEKKANWCRSLYLTPLKSKRVNAEIRPISLGFFLQTLWWKAQSQVHINLTTFRSSKSSTSVLVTVWDLPQKGHWVVKKSELGGK